MSCIEFLTLWFILSSRISIEGVLCNDDFPLRSVRRLSWGIIMIGIRGFFILSELALRSVTGDRPEVVLTHTLALNLLQPPSTESIEPIQHSTNFKLVLLHYFTDNSTYRYSNKHFNSNCSISHHAHTIPF